MTSNLTHNTSQSVFGVGEPLPEALRIVLIAVGFILMSIGVPGNLVVMGTILKVKTLRVPLNMFILNLAICDAAIIGYICPFTLVDLIQGKYPGSEKLCFFNVVILCTVSAAEMFSIEMVAISRFTKVCHTRIFNKIFNKKGTLALCILSWLLGPLTLILGINGPLDLSETYLISAHICCLKATNYAWIIMLLYTVPCYITVIVCYWKVWQRTQESDRNIKNHGNETFARLRHNVDVSQILSNIIIFVCYLFLQSPFIVTVYIFPSVPASIQTTCVIMTGVNSSINCIVYGLLNKNFKRSYRQVLPALRFIQEQPPPVIS